MKVRNILFCAAAGLSAGYALYRTYEALSVSTSLAPAREKSPGRYGRLRRAFMLAGMARSLGGAAAAAYGPFGTSLDRAVSGVPIALRAPLFAIAASLADTLANAGAGYIEGFVIEHRYGTSEQPLSSWIADKTKELALSTAILALLGSGFAWAVRRYPQAWAIVGSAAALPLLVAANVAIPVFVMPMFNTYTPLEGELERKLRALAARYGVGDAQILRMDMSKQTKKANAFVTGIGKTHRIVIGDTLLEHFSDDEIEFVVAHELGHYVSGDTWRMVVAGEIVSAIVLMGAFEMLEDHSPQSAARPITLARITFWASVIGTLVQPAVAAFSRSREWEADHFALQATGDPASGAAAFRRLRDQNLAEDEQPWWYEWLFATHPSLRKRIATLDRASRRAASQSATSR